MTTQYRILRFGKSSFIFAISNIEIGAKEHMWEKISVKTSPGEGIENVTAVLLANGITGMEIVDSTERLRDLKSIVSSWDYADENLLVDDGVTNVVFYIAKGDDSEKNLCKIESELEQLGDVEVIRELSDESWQDEWKKHFKPMKIGNVVIVPVWEEYKANKKETVFLLDPGAAFGTGQHESTELCVIALQKFIKKGDLILDIGCGSGILACISSLIGAKKVVACDIDPIGAVNATKRNAELNGISNIEIYAGDALSDLSHKLKTEKYDVVIANIVADVIMELTPFVKGLLKPSGKFIASGIIGERAAEVRAKFRHEGFRIIWKRKINDWFSYVVSKDA